MIKNFKLTIEYDGTHYHGWQRQKDEPTIQEEIEKAIELMTQQKVSLIGSGRTDAGVHALGQTASFRCATRLSTEIFLNGLNGLLPDDIVIRDCIRVDDDFHARFSVKQKTYQYRILNRPLPSALCRRYAWHIKKELDINRLKTAGSHILGVHDFKSFQGQGSQVASSVRRLISFDVQKASDLIFLDFTGDGFLRFMVRNIVGTLVDVGTGKISPEEFKEVLESQDRGRAGITAPAHGLFLVRVDYNP
jgi:tRNA pseudouridine38-40 synthase